MHFKYFGNKIWNVLVFFCLENGNWTPLLGSFTVLCTVTAKYINIMVKSFPLIDLRSTYLTRFSMDINTTVEPSAPVIASTGSLPGLFQSNIRTLSIPLTNNPTVNTHHHRILSYLNHLVKSF